MCWTAPSGSRHLIESVWMDGACCMRLVMLVCLSFDEECVRFSVIMLVQCVDKVMNGDQFLGSWGHWVMGSWERHSLSITTDPTAGRAR